MVRVTADLRVCATGEEHARPIGMRGRRRGRRWSGKGAGSEHGERMHGTVRIRWEKGDEETLVGVTGLDEREGNAAWSHMRVWMEDEDSDHTSGGWG
jgi:hypothetical protein